jgi:ABC-type polysaccharide transport system permease subunit
MNSTTEPLTRNDYEDVFSLKIYIYMCFQCTRTQILSCLKMLISMVLHISIYSLFLSKRESALNGILSKMTVNPAAFSHKDPRFLNG